MELSILLIQQICQLFIMIFFGFLLVRVRVLTAENSKVLSILLLYVACPCAIINSFMIDFTPDKLIGLGISFLGAILVHIIFIPLANLLGKIFGFTPIEKATIIYSNSGNLIIPLVGAILGNEWVIYSSGYMVIQTILLWTHAKSLVCNEPSFDLKKILLNINIIAIVIGICLFMFHLQLPTLIDALEHLPKDKNLTLCAERLHFIDHACVDYIKSWEKERREIMQGYDIQVAWEEMSKTYPSFEWHSFHNEEKKGH